MTDPLKLLVIENNQSDILILQEAFLEQDLPVRIEWADSGHKAISTFLTTSVLDAPDVILVDYHLTGINGLDVIHVLSRNCTLLNTAIILISGMMDDPLRKLCKKAGACDALEKPRDFQGYLSLAASLHVTLTKVKTERLMKPEPFDSD